MGSTHRVVIVGGGFGGLRAARALKDAPVDVTVVDKRNYHLFQPLLYQVATGSLSEGEIASPLRGVLGKQVNTRVLLGEVTEIDPDARRVRLADGLELEYDSLIVATGSRSHYYGNDSWSQWAPSMKSIEEATEIRHKILYAFEVAERLSIPEERRAWLTFVIVGAGATGVELAGAIAEIAKQTLRHDFRSIHPEEARIVVVDGGPRVLSTFPEDLSEKALATLTKLGVQVKTGVRVKGIDKEGLTVQGPDGDARLAAHTVIWAGGVAASALGRTLAEKTKAATDRSGRIPVGPRLTIDGYSDIYVVGDLALSLDAKGNPLGGVAQVAMQQGTYAGKAIARKVLRRPEPRPFHYFDKGTLAVIGRWKAVANVSGIHLSGLPAWAVWAFIHVMYLVEFQSRVLVFIQWAIQDLTFNRGARLITGNAPTDFSFDEAVAASARNRSSAVEDRGEAAAVASEPALPDPSPPSGRLTVLGLLAIGAFPVLAFCLWLLLTVGRHVPAVGGGNVPSILSPASGHAKSLFDLSIFVFAVTGTIFFVVFGLLAHVLVRYGRTAKTALREPPQVYGSSRIEIAWTVVPVLIVLVLFLSTARVIHAVQDAARPPGALDVTVVGHQFWWEFRYPTLGIVTANELHVPLSDSAHRGPRT